MDEATTAAAAETLTDGKPAADALPPAFASVEALVALIVNPADAATRLRELRARLTAATAAESRLAAAREKFAREQTAARAEWNEKAAEVARARAQLGERMDALAGQEDDLRQREERMKTLERRWRNIGEPDDVLSGFREPAHSALYKARIAHGVEPVQPDDDDNTRRQMETNMATDPTRDPQFPDDTTPRDPGDMRLAPPTNLHIQREESPVVRRRQRLAVSPELRG